ncbi:MAG: hypothetical protein ACFE8J_09810 [Candidatus Heimdallarchaeota archaeon]
MRYIFKVLVFGLDVEAISQYCVISFQEGGEFKESYIEWYKEFNVFEDVCDLEIDCITNVIKAEFDEVIPIVDGIIYFLNPLKQEENEFFEILIPIIDSVKRNIPTVIMYYNQDGLLPISINELLENLWIKYPHLEAFVNLPSRDFHQAIECLCMAMITGDTPLNIENAWMRFPIYIQLANIYFKQKEYYYAAHAIKKAGLIAEIFNKQEYYIISEQSAILFSKVNLYLEASKILEEIDKKKSENFKKLHIAHMNSEGHRLFNKKLYDQAAVQYLAAAQFAAIEIRDRSLRNEAFRNSINAWVSACNVEKAFQVVNSLPHEGIIIILNEISNKILAAVDYLVSIENYFSAKDQLYQSIAVYQKEGLFEIVDQFTPKLVEVLARILEIQINNEEKYAAKQTFDEIENLWESYGVKKKDIDKLLAKLIRLFLEIYNFGMASNLINKLNSLSLKKKLTKESLIAEEKSKELRKREITENIQRGVNIIYDFLGEEQKIITEINTQIIKEANILIESNDYLKAADRIKIQADFLKNIGKYDDQNQLLTQALDVLLVGKKFDEFFSLYFDLTEGTKKVYLEKKFPVFIKMLKDLREEGDFDKNDRTFANASRIYRDQMLYEQSKELSELYIGVIKEEAIRTVNIQENEQGINKAITLIKKAIDISSAYLEKDKINVDDIYKKITEIYINLEDLSTANAINDLIEDKWIQTELHKSITKAEAAKIEAESKKVKDIYKGEILKEKFSIIQKRTRDALNERERELKQRRALKRSYFTEAIDNLVKKELEDAIKKYRESIDRLIKIKLYNLAGVSLAILSLILIIQGKINEVNKMLINTKKELSGLGKSFSETYPVTLIEYILDIRKFQDDTKFKESLLFFENLPLFEEEVKLLYDFVGKAYKKEKKELDILEVKNITEAIKNLADQILKEKQDIAKRKLMKNQYWRLAIEDLSNNKLTMAAKDYLDTINTLIDKKFFKQAAISLILATFILLKLKDIAIAKSTFFDKLSKFEKYKSDFEDLPEIQLMKEIFFIIENNMDDLIELAITGFLEKLALEEPELDLIESFLPGKQGVLEEKEILSREEKGEKNRIMVEQEQKYAYLKQQMGDIRRERLEILNKRSAMKRLLYKEVLTLLENNQFKVAGEKYLELAKSMSRRQDFQISSLLLLLHGLALLKAGVLTVLIRTNINEVLNSLGLNKKLVEDTYFIRCIIFILDVILYKIEKFSPKIRDLLEILPLFEQEKIFIDIDLNLK